MSDSVQPHRRQPTRLLCPWDTPGKNTGVGYHFLLQCMHACKVASVVSDCVRPNGQQPTRLLCPRDSLGKNTGVGCHFLLLGSSWSITKTNSPLSPTYTTYTIIRIKITHPDVGRRKWQPIPVFLPREFHGQRSLVGCCPWGRTESDMTEAT